MGTPQVVMLYTVGIAAALFSFQMIPGDIAALQWLNVFMIGFFLYGPQMLIGLCGAELVGPDSVGASEGFLGWVAYLGAANAGGCSVKCSVLTNIRNSPVFFNIRFVENP